MAERARQRKLDQKTPPMGNSGSESLQKTVSKSFLPLFACLFAGIVFGFAMEKGRVFEPMVIRSQMVFRKWIMMKMFLSAMATGMICFALLSIIPVESIKKNFKFVLGKNEGNVAHKNGAALVFGPIILGIGMSLAGACPGMVLPQVGAWTSNSIFTLFGALAGAFAYSLLHDRFYFHLFPADKWTIRPITLPKLCGMKYSSLAFVIGSVLLAVVLLLEYLVPWESEVEWSQFGMKDVTTSSLLQKIAWPPSICGALIGSLQLMVVSAVSSTLGGSTSYCTVVAQFISPATLTKFPYLARFKSGLSNWWQVVYVTGGIVGGALSALLSGTLGQVPGVPILYAFLGGFCLVFGARIGSGCTSGHGLSGMGLLLLGSFLAVPCMFLGAISTAVFLEL